jgi:DNA-binding NarL/FixJ family response regulator
VTIRVIVADDESLIRAGIRLVLANAPDIEIVAEAADGREAVELVRRHQVDVALLDIRMPKIDGLAAAADIRSIAPAIQVLMLTTFGEQDYVATALRGGAAGFLLKDTAPDELIRAVHVVASGDAVLSPAITRQLIDRCLGPRDARADRARHRLAVLTDKEREVIGLVGGGRSNAEIAAALIISEGTAKVHVSRILAKLDCANRVQAAILARDADLVPPE